MTSSFGQRVVLMMTLCAAAALVAVPARAGDPLAKVDTALNGWRTLDYRYTIRTTSKSGPPSTIKLRMRMRKHHGDNQQLIEISAPADMRGTKVLTASPTKMYIYLPAFKKIRRIASHMTEQGFLGTSLSQRDMTLTRYSDYYTARKSSDESKQLTLELTAKPGAHAPYPKIELTIGRKHWLPSAIQYFNDSGQLIKTETRSVYHCGKGYCTPGRMKVADHTSGVTSVLILEDYTINPALPAKIFGKRILTK